MMATVKAGAPIDLSFVRSCRSPSWSLSGFCPLLLRSCPWLLSLTRSLSSDLGRVQRLVVSFLLTSMSSESVDGSEHAPNGRRTDFLAGQYFDIRLEVHAPVNGSEATGNSIPDTNFTFTVARQGRRPQGAASYFKIAEPALERWNFTWYEGNIELLHAEIFKSSIVLILSLRGLDYFARDVKTPSLVNVASKIYRRVALYQPGEYTATLTYNNGQKTTASWLVRDLATARKTKNIVLFIGVCPNSNPRLRG